MSGEVEGLNGWGWSPDRHRKRRAAKRRTINGVPVINVRRRPASSPTGTAAATPTRNDSNT